MERLVIRHSVSSANDKNSPAFGSPDAHLLPAGHKQAQSLEPTLANEYGVTDFNQEVAVSYLLRTQETARSAGFHELMPYALLNEITTELNRDELYYALERKVVPRAGIERAEQIIAEPPKQQIWFTHGLVIAALCEVLGVYGERTFVPKFCEIRTLSI